MNLESNGRKIRVAVSTIDLRVTIPYIWGLLKTYSEELNELKDSVIWEAPIHHSVKRFKKLLNQPSFFIEKHNIRSIDILGLSCYTWSTEYQVRLARLVKEINPSCLIVAGGPDLSYADPSLFSKFPNFDLVVKSDGEIPFRKILLEVVKGTRSFDSIPGLVLNTQIGPKDTGTPEVIKTFNLSPWLSNQQAYEDIVKGIRTEGEDIRVVYETNRGCPYGCTYCNWGSNTKNKIRLFDMDNIKAEMEWFRSLGVDKIMVCDANVGILERDLDIAKLMAILGNSEKPPSVVFYPAKNNSDRVVDISEILFNAGLMDSFSLGVQNTDLKVLAAIGRANMRISEQKKLVEGLNKRGIPVIASLILGCPGSTVDTWRQCLIDLISIGVEDMMAWKFHVLPNTVAADPTYQDRWKIQLVEKRDDYFQYNAKYICASSSFTVPDLVEMKLFYLLIQAVKSIESVITLREFLVQSGRATLRSFYDHLYDWFFNESKNRWAKDLNILRTSLMDFFDPSNKKDVFRFVIADGLDGKPGVPYNAIEFLHLRIVEDLDGFNDAFFKYVREFYQYSSSDISDKKYGLLDSRCSDTGLGW